MSPLIPALTAAAMAAGAAIGWLLGRRRRSSGSADWQRRLAARDRDLARVGDEMADQTLALQEAEARIADLMHRLDAETDPDPGFRAEEARRQRARADALAERLRAAEGEIARLRSGDEGGDGSAHLAHRVEELEAELTTLSSHRCPDPAAHSRSTASLEEAVTEH